MANVMEQLAERVSKASAGAKVGSLIAAAALLTGGNWFFLTDNLASEIEQAEQQRKNLEADFINKQQIAQNLNEYRREKELLEQRLQEALAELPNDKAIDELLRQVNDVGVKSGLQITSVEPQAEQKEQFYARIPVKMKVTGNYHEVAVFFDSVGKLKRIVNVGDIRFANPAKKNEKVIFDAEFQATTFRFLDPAEAEAEAKAAKTAKGAKPR